FITLAQSHLRWFARIVTIKINLRWLKTYSKKSGTNYGDLQQTTIKLGESAPVVFVFVLTTDDVTLISSGGSITISIEISAVPIYFGIPLSFIAQDLPPQDIIIP
ncbi:unnamed protein product, partial [marine sediment metagenome]